MKNVLRVHDHDSFIRLNFASSDVSRFSAIILIWHIGFISCFFLFPFVTRLFQTQVLVLYSVYIFLVFFGNTLRKGILYNFMAMLYASL